MCLLWPLTLESHLVSPTSCPVAPSCETALPLSWSSPCLHVSRTYSFPSAFDCIFFECGRCIPSVSSTLQEEGEGIKPSRPTKSDFIPSPAEWLVSLLYNSFLPAFKEFIELCSCLCHHHILTLGIFVFSIEPNSVDCIFASTQEINAELDKIIIASLSLAHLTAVSFAVLISVFISECRSIFALGRSVGINTVARRWRWMNVGGLNTKHNRFPGRWPFFGF